MKLHALVSAGLVAMAMLASTPAVAAHRHNGYGHGHGHGWKWKKVCKTRYYHGHKGSWCRNVRGHW